MSGPAPSAGTSGTSTPPATSVPTPHVTIATETERMARERTEIAREISGNWIRLYGLSTDVRPLAFTEMDFPYPSVRAYLDAFAWWRNYVPPPPLPAGEDPVALAAANAHLNEQAHRIEVEFNTEIPHVWEATSFNVVGQRCLIWGATLAIAGIAVGAAIGGPYGAVIGGAIGLVAGICLGLVPWEASAFFYNWGQLVDQLTVEERYGLWRNAHDAMNQARRVQGQGEAEFEDGWQFATNRAHILTGPITDLTFLCFQYLLRTECFPRPPHDQLPTRHIDDMTQLPPVARYALGILASTEPPGSTTTLDHCALWRNLEGTGNANQWLLPFLVPFRNRQVAEIRRSLRAGPVLSSDPTKPPALNTMRDIPMPPYVLAAVATREAALRAAMPPRTGGH